MGDIDFLVSDNDYLGTAKIMQEEGYSRVSKPQVYKDINTFKHYPKLIHPNYEAIIETHRIPVEQKYLSWFNSSIIEKGKKKPKGLSGYYVLSDHYKIIYNFIHSQLSNEGNLLGIVSLKDLNDLYLLSIRFPIEESISEIKPRKKAIAYFAFARVLLGLNESFYRKRNFTFWILLKKHSTPKEKDNN